MAGRLRSLCGKKGQPSANSEGKPILAKRLGNRWMSRGHVAWHDWTWQTGPESTRFDDPTPALDGGDLDSQRLLLPVGDSVLPHEPARFLGSHWSFHLAGGIGLPRDVFLSLAVDGREGVPLAGYRQVVRERAGLVRVPVAGEDFRTSDLITADLNLSKDILLHSQPGHLQPAGHRHRGRAPDGTRNEPGRPVPAGPGPRIFGWVCG